MREIKNWDIAKGTRLAITRKDGRRYAGVATRKIRPLYGLEYTVRIKTFTGDSVEVYDTDIATIHAI